jgi:hypothetical protein
MSDECKVLFIVPLLIDTIFEPDTSGSCNRDDRAFIEKTALGKSL